MFSIPSLLLMGKNIFGFFQKIPLWVYAVLAICIGVYFYGEHRYNTGESAGETKVQKVFTNYKIAQAEANAKAIKDKEAENQRIKDKQDFDHAQEIAHYEKLLGDKNKEIDRNTAIVRNGGLWVNLPGCKPTTSTTTKADDSRSGNGATSTAFELPAAIEEGLYRLAEDDDREIAKLESKLSICQQFAIDNGFTDKLTK
jgi:hypothetical protein